MRNALPENSAPGLSESVLTLETSRPPVWPVPEYEYIGTQFGAGHRGTDIAAREGAEILAVWDGTVLEAEYHENWGDYVLLDHDGGIITRYAHCSELLVQPGDTVKAGEAVARVGNTGVASGNHCHLELERNGVLLDPMQKLSAPRDETPRTQARQPEPQNAETWLPPDNELIKERLAGTTGVWPVPEYTFVSRSVGRYHRGVDITAKKGADIVAPFSGTVTRAEDGEETQYWVYGKYVEIALDGDPGVYSARYAMMAGEGSGDAANNALMKVDLNDPSSITAVIPENEKSLLENVTAAGGYFFASYLQDAQSKVVQYGFDGKPVRDIELPGICTAAGFDGDDEAAEIYYSVSGYTAPATIYKLDVASGESTLFKAPDVNFDPALFTTEQVFYTSKDGTKVPMFITHRKDLKLDGKNPCYLYAYGGFQINRTPGFRPSAIMFVEQGGVFCEANLRGGSEYGEAWHKAGMLENKQNVFDDFIAAAEYLIANKYTSKDKLAIAGGSNGGLLVGACEVQRPDLYAVCLPAVGVMDMLRYHKFTIGWGWAVEYGSSENEEQFDYIYKYSPLHNIREGVQYPATLVTTADHDDRVVPAHSFKFTAQMQHCQAGDAPILIRIESKAGHGAGKPTSKRIDEEADTYAFLFQNIGVPYKPVAK